MMAALFTSTCTRPRTAIAVAHHPARLLGHADVDDGRVHARRRAGSGAHLVEQRAAARDREHRRALVDEGVRDRPADTARRTGDDDVPALEASHGSSLVETAADAAA